ncbi:Uncharacterised protein [Mycobacteroides abscessus subsp. abscessus]|nr:Uncharacterised protein [Mycobacteroides abscessus subsp. abscessus]SKN08635.1 Uncharacterised protein [Mycobacteroides abscessus subsp. massiliense]SHP59492.1 Uncharacterised protein [Mycobacteroides abscessus subsp. abscessus]SHP82664.1 Uncharacterised protein [Mycobacteroides abscessus subsp. abscessus]SHP94272.1 Uncharacterised protein [Mycobacteroides abscessus subsp. abscessus]
MPGTHTGHPPPKTPAQPPYPPRCPVCPGAAPVHTPADQGLSSPHGSKRAGQPGYRGSLEPGHASPRTVKGLVNVLTGGTCLRGCTGLSVPPAPRAKHRKPVTSVLFLPRDVTGFGCPTTPLFGTAFGTLPTRLTAPHPSPTRARMDQIGVTHRAPHGVPFRTKTSGNTTRLIAPDDPPNALLAGEKFQSRARTRLLNHVVRLGRFPTVFSPSSRDHIRHRACRWQSPQAPANSKQQQLGGVSEIKPHPRPIGFTVEPGLHPSD